MTDQRSAAAGNAAAGTQYNLVFVPGDGIGPEVIAAGRKVLEGAGRIFGFGLSWREILIGGVAIEAYGVPLRDDDLAACADADAVYFGAIGDPKYDDPKATVRPEQALLALRKGLGRYANLRPGSIQPVLRSSSPVKEALLEGVDMMIVRELTGGLYFGKPSGLVEGGVERHVVDTLTYTESEIRRVVKLAFELARGRRKKLTSVDKANVLSSSRLWRTIVEEVRIEYPDVTVEHRLVDACAMTLIQRPAVFDVLVTENLFGDILSDEASVLAGSLGMLPSASIGEKKTAHGLHGLYEPIHGAAPDIAGKDIANPLATILSGAMMLRWSLGQNAAAEAIERAVTVVLNDGCRTADLLSTTGDATGLKPVGTQQMGQAVLVALMESAGVRTKSWVAFAPTEPGASR